MTTDTLPKPEKRRAKPVVAGARYGTWTVISMSDVRKNGHIYWNCMCDCGVQKPVAALHLKGGKSANCGCLKSSRLLARATTHGQAGTRTHRIWQNMRGRCRNPNLPDFKYYGGRGIKVCERWNVFENFLADMGECPPDLSIDRIDVNGNYEPGNCRWATQKEQTNNQRKNVRLTLNGRTQTLQQWADELKLDASMIRWRLDEGWSVERALTEPSLKTQRHTVTIDGVTLKLREWSERTGVPYSSIIARYARGLRGREAVYGGARAR
jgi:hypothetical protein